MVIFSDTVIFAKYFPIRSVLTRLHLKATFLALRFMFKVINSLVKNNLFYEVLQLYVLVVVLVKHCIYKTVAVRLVQRINKI